MYPHISTVLVGLPAEITDEQGAPWRSGFIKRPVAGPVDLGLEHLVGDGQEDRRFHGGPEKAMLAYCVDHYPHWNRELERTDFAAGAFGENLAISGLDETTVAIGDVFQIGTAEVQVSQPRQPCWKLARRCRLPTLPAKAIANGRLGWYFRVTSPGTVTAGDHVQIRERHAPEWTIARINRLYFAPKVKDRAELTQVFSQPGVSPEFITLVEGRLGSGDSTS